MAPAGVAGATAAAGLVGLAQAAAFCAQLLRLNVILKEDPLVPVTKVGAPLLLDQIDTTKIDLTAVAVSAGVVVGQNPLDPAVAGVMHMSLQSWVKEKPSAL